MSDMAWHSFVQTACIKVLKVHAATCITESCIYHTSYASITLSMTLHSLLQCVAVFCSVLQCVAVCVCVDPHTHFNTLQHTATHCNTLQHAATHCNTLQNTATHCNRL